MYSWTWAQEDSTRFFIAALLAIAKQIKTNKYPLAEVVTELVCLEYYTIVKIMNISQKFIHENQIKYHLMLWKEKSSKHIYKQKSINENTRKINIQDSSYP